MKNLSLIQVLIFTISFLNDKNLKPTLSVCAPPNDDLIEKFVPIYSYDILSSDEGGIVIGSSTESIIYDCFQKCLSNSICKMISFKSNQCKTYNEIRYSPSTQSQSLATNPCLFKKYARNFSSIDPFLVNHWSFDNNFIDLVTGNSLTVGSGTVTFDDDRFNQKNRAVRLNDGYLTIPSGVYFNGNFTVSAWIKLTSQPVNELKLFDFGKGQASDNVGMTLQYSTSGPYIYIYNGGGWLSANRYTVSNGLIVGRWYHLAVTLQGTFGKIYVNGQLAASGTSYSPLSITRTKNYIGRSNWIGEPQTLSAIIDDFKIFNKALTKEEVIAVLNC